MCMLTYLSLAVVERGPPPVRVPNTAQGTGGCPPLRALSKDIDYLDGFQSRNSRQ
jgi:hypothetical protein